LKFKYLFILLLPAIVFASEGEAHEGTDIMARSVNFIIFAGILYYLIADKIKAFFKGRTNQIASQLTNIQEQLNSAKKAKEDALSGVKEADEKAKELVELAQKEAVLLEEKIAKDAQSEISHLEKAFEERMQIEEKKMSKEVVSEVIDTLFAEGKIKLSNDDFLNIIKKKVA